MTSRVSLLVLLLAGAVATGVGISNYYKAVTFVGMVVMFGALHLVAVEFDWHLFKTRRGNPAGAQPAPQPKVAEGDLSYRPNLLFWGMEILLGLGVVDLYFFSITCRRLLESPPANNLELLQNLTLLGVFAFSLGFIVWGIVRICRAE
jgi:hypothetical protein